MNDTEQIVLPVTGYIVTVRNYFTVGQARMLQKILLGNSVYDAEKGQIQGTSVDSFLTMQEKAVELIITDVKDKEGNQITQAISGARREWIDGLPQKDGEILLKKVNEIQKESGLSEEAKKN